VTVNFPTKTMAEAPTPSSPTPVSPPTDDTMSKPATSAPRFNLAAVLTQARRDLWSAQPWWPLGFVLRPIRLFVWDPWLAITSILVPPLVPSVVDTALAHVCRYTTLPLIHVLYPKTNMALASESSNQSSATTKTMQSTAKNTLLHTTPHVVALEPPSDLQSAFQGSVSFIISAIGDILGAFTNPSKLKGWTKAMAQFNGFLESSGVAAELQESLIKPLWQGRLLDNLKILNDIQLAQFANRAEICLHESCPSVVVDQHVTDGQRLMRFATAAYGTEMIKSAIDRQVEMEEIDTLQEAISVHTNIRQEDIKLVYAESNSDQHILHHFVAVDRASKSIVLALRGTLSLSGAIVDVQGMAVDYCSGQAHQGIAEMADNVWKQSGDFVLNLLLQEKEFQDYQLLITGHSLGAGTACLLTVKLYHEQVLNIQRNKIICYAFAPPPTFYCASPSPQIALAIQNTVGYIHDNDVVPFLSIPVVRRLAALLDAVDNQTEFLWFWKRWRIFYEFDTIPETITQSVMEANSTKPQAVEGASDLAIPANIVLWCKKESNGKFKVLGCDPKKVAEGNIFLCEDMLTDHLPEQYEDALDALAGKEI